MIRKKRFAPLSEIVFIWICGSEVTLYHRV
jgi:hypothetical protein